MIEAPEALVLARQMNKVLMGKKITDVIGGNSPHKFAWYNGRPEDYEGRLLGKTVDRVCAKGGMVEISVADAILLFTDGVNFRYLLPGEKLPEKYQLLIGFDDFSCLTASVRMYGGLICFIKGEKDIPFAEYYRCASEKPQVLSDNFDENYFRRLITDENVQDKSVKAFLATNQTIPGLGNGVLQDILYNAGIHPKSKLRDISEPRRDLLYKSVKTTLTEMFLSGGRNTETDILGKRGKYISYLSKDTVGKECPRCGEIIRKESYMGGSIYYCSGCQQ